MGITSAALAVVVALLGAACYAAGAALQQHQASSVKMSAGLDPRLLVRLVQRPRWLAGIAANAVGAGLHVFALSLAPLALVQPIGVMTVVFAVPAGALLRRRRPSGAELAGAGIVSVALGLLVSTLRAQENVAALAPVEVLSLAGIVVGVLALTALAVRRTRGVARTVVLSSATGIAFGITSALLRPTLHGIAVSGATVAVGAGLLAVVGIAAMGLLLEQSSFQAGRLGLAVAVVTVVDPIAAVAAGAGFLHQPVDLGAPWLTAVAVLAIVAGVAVLARRFPTRSTAGDGRRRTARLETSLAQARPAGSGLRVLIGADTYPPDVNGAAYYTRRLALGLAARGYEVHVVCPSATGQPALEMVGPVRVHRVRSMRTPFHDDFRVASPARVRTDVARVLQRVCPDVVHVQNHFLVGRVLCRLAGRRGLPLVATNHFMPDNLLPYLPLPGPVARAVARFGWRDLARVFAPAGALTTPTPTAARLVRASGIGKEVEAVSNGIDLARFRQRDVVLREGDERTLLFVGRLDAEKHIDELIDALPVIRTTVDARLVVAGVGGLREALEWRAIQRGVAEHVDFLGFVSDDDLPGLYASADVFCMPGTAELQSLATLEAMATGCPVVAADAMALPHLCQHGRNGFLHQPHRPDELAEHVTTVLTDDALRERMGKESRAIASEHDEARSLQRFEEIYAEVTGLPVSTRPASAPEPEPIAA
ncbi:MAG: DMT family transporter [Streptosporangiales bacterium]